MLGCPKLFRQTTVHFKPKLTLFVAVLYQMRYLNITSLVLLKCTHNGIFGPSFSEGQLKTQMAH